MPKCETKKLGGSSGSSSSSGGGGDVDALCCGVAAICMLMSHAQLFSRERERERASAIYIASRHPGTLAGTLAEVLQAYIQM